MKHTPHFSFSSLSFFVCTLMGLLLVHGTASAQWAEQTITLQPGWNAIFLEVEPLDTSPEVVFAGVPVESAWRWNPPTSFVQYIQDPTQLKPDDPEWLAWFPPDHPESSTITSLHAIFGGLPYLVKLDAAVATDWTVIGIPKLPRIRWLPNSPNLAGFHLMAGQEPTFGEFFAPSDAHGNDAPEVYSLSSAGEWERTDPATRMQQGTAYWIACNEASDYTGPLAVKTSLADGLDFGTLATTQTITIANQTAAAVTVSVTPRASSASGPAVDGMVPLSYWLHPVGDGSPAGWTDITGPFDLTYDASEDADLKLAIRRTALPGPGVYLSLLDVRDNAGMRILVPVSTGSATSAAAKKRAASRGRQNTRASEPVDAPPDRTGLWVGYATINGVNEPAGGGDPNLPLPTYSDDKAAGSEFSFRLMLHVDAVGNVNLLREVIQLVCGDAKRQVLFTDYDAVLNSGLNCQGTGIRDGRLTGRRMSGAAFSFDNPLAMTGTFEIDNTLDTAYDIGFDDPLNPLKHRYHPGHDNKDAGFDPITDAALAEAPEISRSISLLFTSSDPTNMSLSQAGWGDTAMGGIYRETLVGLHKDTLYVSGEFRVTKVTDVQYLNDGG